MALRFGSIDWLWLLPPALLFVWALGRGLATLSPARRWTVLITRSLLFACLILALSRIEFARTSNDLAVMFAVDVSDSIPPELRQYSLTYIKGAMEQMGRQDKAGILLFGANASIERNPQPKTELEQFESVPERTQTNIAEAIRLAMAALPANDKKRIVLLSDGNETAGQAEEAARAAAGNHVALDVVPLHYEFREDVILDKVVVENQVAVDEPFDVKVYVESRRQNQAKLNIFRDRQLIESQDVTLEAGRKNVFALAGQAVREPGFHSYTAQVEVPGDANPENNSAHAFTMAQGEPRILFVEGGPLEENRLVAMLRAEQIQCDLIRPEQFPHDPAELQTYNSIVLCNVPAADLDRSQMQLIERAAHDMGVGLVMIGGEHSFGAGGWQDTPVEQALPVDMDIKHKKVLPQGALVLILHTMEIPEGEYWGREIAIAALNVLSARDEFGVLVYMWNSGESWLIPLQPAEDKGAMRRTIHGARNGDMPMFDPTLKMAHTALQKSHASVKHVVIISDGDPSPPTPALIQAMRADKITISTVHIAGHGPRDQQTMASLAEAGGGRFYPVTNNQQLPQIFVKEASVVRRSLIFEEPFTPVVNAYSDALVGIGRDEYPRLQGYVGATPKELADVPLVTDKKDPLLAHWRYGLGKAAAFTSDARMRWAVDWFAWNKMSKFWSQVARWTLRAQASRNLQMTATIDEGQGKVVIDAVDDEGKFLNFLAFQAHVLPPDYQSRPLDLRQTGPGRYEASFPVGNVGTYLVTAQAEGAGGFQDLITGGTSLSYSPEFQTSRSNDAVLRKLCDVANGRVLGEKDLVFDHNLPSGREPRPVWPLLTAAALILLPVDIFFRRVLIDWKMAAQGLAAAWAFVCAFWPRRRAAVREQRMEALLDAKRQVQEVAAARRQTAGRQAFLEQLDQVQPDQDLVEQAAGAAKGPREALGPAAPKPKAAPAEAPSASSSYTSKLLEAKKRARR